MDFPFYLSLECTIYFLITIVVIIILFLPGKSVLCPKYGPDYENAIPVIDILKALGKICPINSLNNWTLVSNASGYHRCWTQRFSVPVLNTNIPLYGSATVLNYSPANIYSLISDVSKWNEWNPTYTSQYIVNPFNDKKLRSDHYMEVEQIVSRKSTKIESQTFMYRFHDFLETNVGWLLFWNAKKLEFMFFLVQPVRNKNETSQCVLTHIIGSEASKKFYASSVVQRLGNIQDFLSLSSLNLLPLNLICTKQSSGKISSQVETEERNISYSENSYLLPSNKPHKKENEHTVCILVPFVSSCMFGKHIDRYKLGVKNMENATSETKYLKTVAKQEQKSSSKTNPAPKSLRRTSSDVGRKSQVLISLNKHSEVSEAGINEISRYISENKNQKQISDTTSEDSEAKSNTNASQRLKIKDKPFRRVQLRSYSETALHDLDDCKLSNYAKEDQNDSDTGTKLEHINENAENTLLALDSQDQKEMFNSSMSDFEVVENTEFTENIMASFVTQGNYGASELQAEVLLASHLEKDINSEKFQFAGDWLFHSNYKGLCVLTKTTSSQFMTITSFLCQIDLPVSPKDVWKFVKNPQFRYICDETVKAVDVLEKLSSSQKLIHTYHEVGGILKKELIDFCLLQTEREELNKYYSCFYSIEYDKCPFMNSVTRGTLRPSGWIVEKVDDAKRSKVTYMIQALINSPDSLFIHELSNAVPQSVYNLKNYITSKPM